MKLFFTIFTLIFLLSSSLFATNDTIEVKADDHSLLEHSEIYFDIGGKASYDEIIKNQNFTKNRSDFLSLGYLTDQAIWIRFTLSNISNNPKERILHIDNSILDSITLYYPDGKTTNVGALNHPPFDGIIDFHIPIILEQNSTQTYYVRILSNTSPTYFHLNLETKDILWIKSMQRSLILTFFFALIFTLVIYNSFIYLFTREKVYLYYALFMLMISYNHFFSYTGLLQLIFYYLHSSDSFVKSFTIVDAYLGIFYFYLLELFFILFFMELVNTKRFFYIHKLFQGVIGLASICLFISTFSDYYLLDLLIYISMIMFILAWIVIIYMIYKKEENGFYLSIGLGVNMLGHIVWLLFNFGTYIPEGGYWYFYEISLAIEGLLFSIVLSKKLNHTKALATALNTQQVLIRELHHRVKNNLQFIVSLYRLKLRPYLDTKGKEILSDAESNVHSIAKIHEILYAHQNISSLDASVYINDLVKTIQRGYPKENVTITIHSDVSLLVDNAIYCGLIINELVTNGLKYAFEPSLKGEIIINLKQDDKTFILQIFDNGKGFDWEKNKDSFGLSLVQGLVKNELKGTLEFDIENGSHYNIKWN